MQFTVWMNTLASSVGILLGVLLVTGSVISIANMKVSWAGLLLWAAMFVPVMFAISGIGVWIAYVLNAESWVLPLVILPWVYGVLFVLAMLFTFWVHP